MCSHYESAYFVHAHQNFGAISSAICCVRAYPKNFIYICIENQRMWTHQMKRKVRLLIKNFDNPAIEMACSRAPSSGNPYSRQPFLLSLSFDIKKPVSRCGTDIMLGALLCFIYVFFLLFVHRLLEIIHCFATQWKHCQYSPLKFRLSMAQLVHLIVKMKFKTNTHKSSHFNRLKFHSMNVFLKCHWK